MRSAGVWKELGLEPTQEKSAVKKAYAQKLKTLDLATDQEAFQRLRQAFEWAMAHCQRAGARKEAPPQETQVFQEEKAGEGEAETPQSPEPQKPSKKAASKITRPLPVENPPAPDPREKLYQAADRITLALERGQEREAAYELSQASTMEDFQSLEGRWFLAELLLNRLRQFRGRMPVAFCLAFVKHFGLKPESNKDFPRVRDMVELLLQVAELRGALDGVKKRKFPWPGLNALQRIQLPYHPYLTWFYGFTNKPGPLSLSMEIIIEQLERINTDTAALGIDPRMLTWWKGRLERWFRPFRLKSIGQSYGLWTVVACVVYFLSLPKLTKLFHLDDIFLVLALMFFIFAIPLSFLYDLTVFWGIKTQKSRPRYNKILTGTFIVILIIAIALGAYTDKKNIGGTWGVAIVLLFRLLMSWKKKK